MTSVAHVPTHDRLVTLIEAFQKLYLEELPIDPEAVASWLERAIGGDSPVVDPPSAPAGDMIPMREVTFVGGPDIGTWPAVAAITKLTIGLDGVSAEFTKRDGPDRWPDIRTPGWTGDLQYSLGMCLRIGGRWYASAPIETWHGHNVIGGPIQSTNVEESGIGQIPKNWFYDARWAPMNGYQPKAGESIGLFVCAGDARNNFSPVKERSNVVVVPLPADGQVASFAWTDQGLAQRM